MSKQSANGFFITTGLLLLNYFIRKQAHILENNVSDKEDKNRKSKIKTLYKSSRGILIITILVSLYGFYDYFMKQYNDHRKNSKDFITFLIKFLFEGSNKIYKGTEKVFD